MPLEPGGVPPEKLTVEARRSAMLYSRSNSNTAPLLVMESWSVLSSKRVSPLVVAVAAEVHHMAAREARGGVDDMQTAGPTPIVTREMGEMGPTSEVQTMLTMVGCPTVPDVVATQ
jgi:hypothetical protein